MSWLVDLTHLSALSPHPPAVVRSQKVSDILKIPTGAAASVSHHKSIVTESYQINSRGATSLVIRDLQVPLHLVEPDLR